MTCICKFMLEYAVNEVSRHISVSMIHLTYTHIKGGGGYISIFVYNSYSQLNRFKLIVIPLKNSHKTLTTNYPSV